MSGPFLSVVIPAYNEEKRLGSTLREVLAYLTSRSLEFEVVVVDDHSADATADVVRAFSLTSGLEGRVQVLCNDRNRGKGFSVRRGVLASRGQFALMTDADLSAPIRELPKLEREVVEGECHLAFGSRDVEGSLVTLHQSWFREHGGKTFNRMVRLLTGLPYRDTQCGFKLFRMPECLPVFRAQRLETFAFDVEVLYVARKRGLSMKEVPIEWRHAPGSRVRFLSDAPRMLFDLLRIRWYDARGLYRVGGGRAGGAA